MKKLAFVLMACLAVCMTANAQSMYVASKASDGIALVNMILTFSDTARRVIPLKSGLTDSFNSSISLPTGAETCSAAWQ